MIETAAVYGLAVFAVVASLRKLLGNTLPEYVTTKAPWNCNVCFSFWASAAVVTVSTDWLSVIFDSSNPAWALLHLGILTLAITGVAALLLQIKDRLSSISTDGAS